ncbi:MAG: glycosyltransferase [Roseinatronobacter sp.]
MRTAPRAAWSGALNRRISGQPERRTGDGQRCPLPCALRIAIAGQMWSDFPKSEGESTSPFPFPAARAPFAGAAVQELVDAMSLHHRPPHALTVVVPCFNERENIRPLYTLLETALSGEDWAVMFVDDDSPDGTAEVIRALAQEHDNVALLHRVGRRGLAGACIEGILSAINPIVAVMDADLQHDETRLPEMLARLRADPALDLVIGSRHVAGGSADEGFSATRSLGSRGATWMAQKMLGISVSDPMSGFFMLRRQRFTEIVTSLQTQGFKILADILFAARGRWRVAEVGYQFRSRRFGESKLDPAIVLEFMALMLSRLTGGFLPIRFILFAGVGLTGVVVQLAALRLAMTVGDLPFYLAQSFGVWVAMTTNFALNNILTYRDRMLRGAAWFRGLLIFYGVCFIGALMNVGIAELLHNNLVNWALASLAGAVVGALWNFVASSALTWRVR